ncbi:MAG TPA: SDR family NAD(P)-dependent oxidoreductase [Chloroflexota bacterium]|nr:SDR family NAD(P)-dependent oxidoreductase [Chloroflexota bacterium]
MKDFHGKTAVVTGAASGMGRAFAERFAREGLNVVLADVEVDALDRAVAELASQGLHVAGRVTDVSKLESVQALAQDTLERFGNVHVVCNNAGVEGYLDGPIWEAGPKDWAWTFGVNFWGVVHGVQTFLPLMLEHGDEGHIVNTSSATALVRGSNMYGITKHAVRALSETIQAQLQQRQARIGISVLCPGVVNTRLFNGRRNRPAELQTGAVTEASERMRSGWFERAAASTQPPAVADILIDAIRENRFYVLTDHAWDERIRDFCDGIQAAMQP